MHKRTRTISVSLVVICLALTVWRASAVIRLPIVMDPTLGVGMVVEGLNQPTTMAFLGTSDLLVLEKATGKVQRVIGGTIQPTSALDLAVNSASERGLLGIALHPDFPTNPGVYLYWTESTTGADTTVLSQTPLLGNRVDRFIWNGTSLTFDQNLIQLRALQPVGPGETTARGRALGPQYEGDLFVGAARTFLEGGYLFHFNLTGNRMDLAVDKDRVADNNHKFDITESKNHLFGRDFGIATDIQTGPNGNLYVVSLSNGAIYEIFRKAPGMIP